MKQRELLDKAERYIAGASLGMMVLPPDLNFVVTRGRGSKIWDADGREYIDYLLGSGPVILGHANPHVVEAVLRQAALGSTYFALNEPLIEMSEIIVESVPCGRKTHGDNAAIRFQTTGSDTTTGASRLARAFTGRDKVLKFEGGWHGRSNEGQLSSAPIQLADYPDAVPDCDGIPVSAKESVLIAPFNDLDKTRAIAHKYGNEIAAILVEPLQRTIKPLPEFLQGMRDLSTEIGAVLIFDEVVTGFRIAWGGAQEKYGVVPDLACYGKAMSGGYPLSAICGRKDILLCADASRRGKAPYAFLSGTLTGNPIAAAAGLATLKQLQQPGVHDKLHALGEAYREGVEAIGRKIGIPIRVEGDGPVRQVFFERNADDMKRPMLNYRDTMRCDRAKAVWFGHEQIRNGIYITPGAKTYISTEHSDEDLAKTFEVYERILK